MKIELTIGVNERGRPVGEDHSNSKLTDGEVEQIRKLREKCGMTYEQIAKIFEVSKGSIAKICLYERRAQYPVRHKKVIKELAE